MYNAGDEVSIVTIHNIDIDKTETQQTPTPTVSILPNLRSRRNSSTPPLPPTISTRIQELNEVWIYCSSCNSLSQPLGHFLTRSITPDTLILTAAARYLALPRTFCVQLCVFGFLTTSLPPPPPRRI